MCLNACIQMCVHVCMHCKGACVCMPIDVCSLPCLCSRACIIHAYTCSNTCRAHVCTCVHAHVCPHLGMWWGKGDGTVDSRNNLLSFQATRPSAHRISTSSARTTRWVRAAPSLPSLPSTLLFTSLSTLLLTALAFLLSVSPWGWGASSWGLNLIPYLVGSEDLCGCGALGRWRQRGGGLRRTQASWFRK